MLKDNLLLLLRGFPDRKQEKDFLKRLHDPGEIRVIIGTG